MCLSLARKGCLQGLVCSRSCCEWEKYGDPQRPGRECGDRMGLTTVGQAGSPLGMPLEVPTIAMEGYYATTTDSIYSE